MASWDALAEELSTWEAMGKTVCLWWRDDDATAMTPELARLIDLAEEHDIPLALAVIPTGASPGFFDALGVRDHVPLTLLQHGFAHISHALPGEKKSEFPENRLYAEMLGDVAIGLAGLQQALPDKICPVFVPPWNRMAHGFMPRLVNAGISGLSMYGDRTAEFPVPGLRQINTHIDLIAWRDRRQFVGADRALNSFLELIQKRRHSSAAALEPIGLLTHHLDLDDAGWQFCEELFRFTAQRPSVTWASATDLFVGGSTG